MTTEGPSIDVQLAAGTWQPEDELAKLASRAITAACQVAPVTLPPSCEVGVVFADDSMLADLNKRYRGREGATNVLSFASNDGIAVADWSPLLGDIVLSQETISREAQDMEFSHHLTHMVVHGFLHLVGYDHEDETEAETMEQLETRILASMDIPDPYSLP